MLKATNAKLCRLMHQPTESMPTKDQSLELLKVATLVLLVAACFGLAQQRENLKAEAVKHGAAEWLVNPDTGDTTFTWKEK